MTALESTLHSTEIGPGEYLLRLLEAGGQRPGIAAQLVLRERIGQPLPRCWYHVGRVVHAAHSLGLWHEQRTLLLGHDLSGAAELAQIEGDGAALAALLAQALARLPGRPVICELPGERDAQGRSPFWSGLGAHFYRGSVEQARARHGEAWRSHLAAMLPRQLVYTSFLDPAAQAAIGQPAASAAALHGALRAAGFAWRQHINVEDGGPVLERDG